MNREIKFRGINKIVGTFVYGSLITSNKKPYIVNEVVESCEEYIVLENWCPVEKETICQYTGLKDKNGKEIYEGDILKTFSNEDGFLIEKVVFKNGGFYASSANKLDYLVSNYDKIDIKLIGNIYENPELLQS